MNSKKLFLFFCLSFSLPCWGAMQFDGVDDYIDLGNSIPTATLKCPLPVTVTAWIKLTQTTNSYWFRNNYSSSAYQGIMVGSNSGTDVEAQFGAGGGELSTTRRTLTASNAISTGTWYHVACAIRGAVDMSIYVNGLDGGATTYSGTGGAINYALGTARIGAHHSGSNVVLKGFVDDVRFYNRSLSASEIQSIAQSRSRILITDGLLGWWKLDDGVNRAPAGGPSVLDSSVFGSIGTPNNRPVWSSSEVINYP